MYRPSANHQTTFRSAFLGMRASAWYTEGRRCVAGWTNEPLRPRSPRWYPFPRLNGVITFEHLPTLLPHSMFRVSRPLALVILSSFAIALPGCGGGAKDPSREEQLRQVQALSPEVPPPSREDVLLIKRMRTATTEEVKAYIGEIVRMELPEDYAIPQDIIDAGHPRLAADVIAERYPEFSGREGMSLLQAVREDPVRYREAVLESKAMRKVYQDHETIRSN